MADDANPPKEANNVDKANADKPAEFYDVIEEELLENSSNSEEVESEEDTTETSKISATSAESETTTEVQPSLDTNVDNDTVNDVPSDSDKNAKLDPTSIQEDSKTQIDTESNTDQTQDTVDDAHKDEEMEVDNTDAVSETKDSETHNEQHSNASNTSIEDYNDIDDSLADDMDMSDVSSSFAENENVESKAPSPRKKPKKRQPPIMIGYRKRRKVHNKKTDDDHDSFKVKTEELMSFDSEVSQDKSPSNDSRKLSEQTSPASSIENIFESTSLSSRSTRKFSGTYSEVTCADKFCWICHKDGGNVYKCIACPRVYHPKCLSPITFEPVDDPANFNCPECLAILRADTVNTRSPVMQTVNLDQLCTLLKHIISIMRIQKDAHYFFGPVDTREFTHYREYVVYPMDVSVLEKNCKNKMYGCTEAFVADVKWIVHNSIVFNSKAAKITNVAKNLLKICKREVSEIETCAECYYNLLVRKDTWFIEVCKKPHLLLWARLKGFPPWPAKALKYKDGQVDCRFFGAHDKAWVPLKDCYLYSKISPQPVKIKRGGNLDEGIEEIEKHIKKLKDKYGIFEYVQARVPYNPAEEEQQLQMMLPNYSPKASTSTKYLIHPDRIKGNLKPKTLFNEDTTARKPSSDETTSKNEPTKEITKQATSEESGKVDRKVSNEVSTSRKASKEESTLADLPAVDETAKNIVEKPEEQQPVQRSNASTPVKCPSSDSESEESDSSKSTVTSSSSSGSGESKTDLPKEQKRKLVSVKKIETINATVAKVMDVKVVEIPRTVINIVTTNENQKVVAPPITTIVSRPKPATVSRDSKMEIVRSIKSAEDPNKQKSVIRLKNFAKMDKCDNLIKDNQIPPLEPVTFNRNGNSLLRKDSSQSIPNVSPIVHDFDLDKVKDEPVENDGSTNDIPDLTVSEVPPKVVPTKSLLAKPKKTDYRTTVGTGEVFEIEAKKSKNDTNCRTVNITENVTLSLINNQSAPISEPVKRSIPHKQKVTKTFTLPRPVDNTSSSDTGINGFAAKPIRIAPASKNIKLMPPTRVCNGVTVNGTIQPRPNVMVVHPPRPVIKGVILQNGIGNIIDECMSEFQGNFRRAFEETLDKMAGKGDPRARNILLQKEMENLKRNHELVIDEIKRDYEVQIAELRAASIAQKKYDLASERLKFEQEKERAVKEAKSKQWCSNCQKSANYYCCWNTAYCDFECQKEHWNQHMHVCKNDVKKKAAESSENEPPRIMMQNDATNSYGLLNGYDKPNATYTFQSPNITSRSNLAKMQIKSISNTKNNPRPLLPRVTATVTCSPSTLSSSSPMVTATLVDNSFQHVNTSITPLRSTMIGSVNVHPYIRQNQQFHK